MTDHSIVFGDARDMRDLDDESVELAVTSPPYVTTKMEEGQDFQYRNHLELCEEVFEEVYRTLIPDGRFVLNVGDIYTKYLHDDEKLHKVPLAIDTFQRAREAGFRQFDQIIWDKGFTRNFGGPLLGMYPYPPSMFFNNYYEYIFILRKPGERPAKSHEQRDESKLDKSTWQKYMQNWWRIESTTERFDGHHAVFPIELPKRVIELYSFKDDTVIDPFGGSCTTALAAARTGRDSVCYEIDNELEKIIRARLKPDQTTLGDVDKSPIYEFIHRDDIQPGMSQMTEGKNESQELEQN
jgi:site-specific DNA-methyltransferase (adenine-specific)